MKKSRLLDALCACAITFVSLSANAATLLSPSSGPGYFLTDYCPGCAGYTEIVVDVYSNDTPIQLDFNAYPAYPAITEDLTFFLYNSTGSSWSQVTMELLPISDPAQPIDLGFDILDGFTSTATVTNILTNPFSSYPSGIEVSFTPGESSGMHVHGFADTTFIPDPLVDYSITITTSAVPIPAAVWLFGSGLLGLVGMARRKKAS